MATVQIHKVTVTIGKCIDYGKSDKTESNITKDDIADTINYAQNDKTGEITFRTLTNWTHTQGKDFESECKELLDKYPRKRAVRDGEKPALLFHIVQSFDGYIPPSLANAIGREFTDEFLGRYICQVSTHTNTENIHNHIIFCAVNKDGERYNDCDDTYALMRKVSDRICERHGLSILEDTREYKPLHWTDENGIKHSYEPTKRKSDLISEKQKGELLDGNISSYRNSDGFEKSEIRKLTLRETVRKDIDSLLPLVSNYEQLLKMLREQYGYKINDKKKNGEYLAHVTFIPPTSSKGVRDYKIGDGEFYKRENLEKFIEEHNKEETLHREISENSKQDDVPIFDSYDYSKIDISKIDIERRAWRSNEEIKIMQRGNPEKALIKDAQNIENGLFEKFQSNGFEKWQADYIFHHLQENGISDRFAVNTEQLSFAINRVNEIQERLNALHFVEENLIYDYKKVNSIMKGYWDSYNSSFEKLNEVGSKLDKLKFLIDLPHTVEKIQKRINDNSNNSEYMSFEYPKDIELLKKYQKYLSDKGLNSDSSKMQKLIEDYNRWQTTYNRLSESLTEQKNKLLSYERSISILRTTEDGRRNEMNDTWKEYDNIVATEKKTERDNETVRKTQMKKKDDERNR